MLTERLINETAKKLAIEHMYSYTDICNFQDEHSLTNEKLIEVIGILHKGRLRLSSLDDLIFTHINH